MYDSLYMYIEKYNDKMIKNDIEIKKIIESVKKQPSNYKLQDFCKLKDIRKTYLSEVLKKIRNKGYNLNELIYRTNLNDYIIQNIKIKYNYKLYTFSFTSFKKLKKIINEIVKNEAIVNNNPVFDENSDYRDIQYQLKNVDIKIVGVLFNKTKNTYLPFEINYI